jgi:SAM-dependent methyltransferase
VDASGPRGWGDPLYAAVLDATGVGPGSSVLDLGCGAGLFARAAADRGARVTGVDVDPAAVVTAAAEVPEGTFTVGTAEAPPAGRFDVVAAVQLLGHVADPGAVLAAAGRAGGVVAATVWGRPEECDVRLFGEALAPWLGPQRPSAHPLSGPAGLRAVAEAAGLVVDQQLEVSCTFAYPDADELLGPFFDSGPARAVGRRAGPVALRSAVLERMADRRTPEGGYRLTNLFRVLVAHAG